MVLSTAGGVLGVMAGVVLPLAVSRMFDIPVEVRLWTLLLALGIAVAVGVIFGVYPARRAAWMDPIEALRHE